MGGIAVLAGIVYLNLEKVGQSEGTDGEFRAKLNQLPESIRSALSSIDIDVTYHYRGQQRIIPRHNTRDVYFLRSIAGMNRSMYSRWRRAIWYPHVKFHAFGFWYIKSGHDSKPIGYLTFLSLIAYLAACFPGNLTVVLLENSITATFLYFLFALTVIVPLSCTFLSRRLRKLHETCEGYLDALIQDKEHDRDKSDVSLTMAQEGVQQIPLRANDPPI